MFCLGDILGAQHCDSMDEAHFTQFLVWAEPLALLTLELNSCAFHGIVQSNSYLTVHLSVLFHFISLQICKLIEGALIV